MAKMLKHPATDNEWRENLRNHALKFGFHMSLSKAMLEYLCAVADNVMWDRGLYFGNIHLPDNWIASQCSLVKRGLIVRKSEGEFAKEYPDFNKKDSRPGEWSNYKLTPAGKAIIELVKLAGIFIEADAAINKKSRKA